MSQTIYFYAVYGVNILVNQKTPGQQWTQTVWGLRID